MAKAGAAEKLAPQRDGNAPGREVTLVVIPGHSGAGKS